MEEVVRLADHLVLLENGKILDHGQIFDIINSPPWHFIRQRRQNFPD